METVDAMKCEESKKKEVSFFSSTAKRLDLQGEMLKIPETVDATINCKDLKVVVNEHDDLSVISPISSASKRLVVQDEMLEIPKETAVKVMKGKKSKKKKRKKWYSLTDKYPGMSKGLTSNNCYKHLQDDAMENVSSEEILSAAIEAERKEIAIPKIPFTITPEHVGLKIMNLRLFNSTLQPTSCIICNPDISPSYILTDGGNPGLPFLRYREGTF